MEGILVLMIDDQAPRKIPRFIARLMPNASKAELREATENFRRYLAVVRRIHNRLQHERLNEGDSR